MVGFKVGPPVFWDFSCERPLGRGTATGRRSSGSSTKHCRRSKVFRSAQSLLPKGHDPSCRPPGPHQEPQPLRGPWKQRVLRAQNQWGGWKQPVLRAQNQWGFFGEYYFWCVCVFFEGRRLKTKPPGAPPLWRLGRGEGGGYFFMATLLDLFGNSGFSIGPNSSTFRRGATATMMCLYLLYLL